MKIKCLRYYKCYEDVRTLREFHEGKEYDVSKKFGEHLIELKVAEEVKEKIAAPAKKQDKRKKEDKSIK